MTYSSLKEYSQFEFHDTFSEKIYSLKNFFSPFLNEENHLYINAVNFPNITVNVKHPQEIIPLLNKLDVFEYITYCLAYKYIIIYKFSDVDYYFFREEREENKILNNMEQAQNDTSYYLKAYENGLLKEAYLKAKNTNIPVIFTVFNGEAKLLSKDDAYDLILEYKEYFPECDEWELITTDEELNPSLVSFLYINTNDDIYWYDVLSYEYEQELFKKWGM